MKSPQEIINYGNNLHPPIKKYALFSGGNDSMVSTHIAMANGAQEVLHINTGIGVKQTREFVRDICRSFGWPLLEVMPPDKSYRDFVLKYGFPGPAAHRYCYSWLKERALNKVVRETKTKMKDRVMLISGVRNTESARRMGYSEEVTRKGAKVWVAPIFHFDKIDLHEYRQLHNLPVSEVSKKLGLSGECLCGAFASPNEIERIRLHYPDVANEISNLEKECKVAGVPCVWGVRPPKKTEDSTASRFSPMCVGCNESKTKE